MAKGCGHIDFYGTFWLRYMPTGEPGVERGYCGICYADHGEYTS